MDLAAHIDHTLLKPTATREEVAKAAEEAREDGGDGRGSPPADGAGVRARIAQVESDRTPVEPGP